MKCHICLGHIENNNTYPKQSLFTNKLGHDLLKLKQHIIDNYFKIENIPVLKNDLDYLTTNEELKRLLYLLSEFGKFARYYNLDVVTGAIKPSIDVNSLWQEYETELVLKDDNLINRIGNFELHDEAIFEITRSIIIKLERFTRALSRQFTIGRLGKQAQQFSPLINFFLMLEDKQLGNTNYRNETTQYKGKEKKVHKRTLKDEIERKTNKKYFNKKIRRSEFKGEWPFYNDEIIIECRDKHWCVVTINGHDYALNGSAQGRFKLESVHDAGMAILGKSTSQFIEMALELRNK
ncbi:MAG: hypothetical protein L3J35_05460 [Bacteroidales bacterium]|nr:hypothetical protein [Bacteroidales bacterium]